MKSCTIADLADGLDQSIGRPMHSTQLNSTMESAECTAVHGVHCAFGGVIKQAGRISIALGRDLDAPSMAPTWRTLLIKFLYHVNALLNP